ncbi:MAG: fasciclin domain-containing protein [Candidatus Palauibacterales bacterium]|nr:fasciclin domain-containing protein [Candidatus Palauibacterales bacterium]
MKTTALVPLLVAGLTVGGFAGAPVDRTASAPAEDGDTTVTLEEVTAMRATAQEGGTIVEVASQNGSFETLVKAVQAAGLVETLNGDGPFTVFAPTDEAFSKLPEGALEDLLANEEQLKKVLTYHVVPGRVTAADVKGLNSAETVAGESLSISTDYGSVKVGNATVVQADVMASNGVIHVIDTVLLPGQGE